AAPAAPGRPPARPGSLPAWGWSSVGTYKSSLVGASPWCPRGGGTKCRRGSELAMNASFQPLSHGLRHDSSPCTGEPYGQPLRPPLQRNQKHFVGVDVLIDPRAAISRPYGVGAGS